MAVRFKQAFAVTAATLLGVSTLAACGSDETSDDTITMAIQGVSRSNVPFEVAMDEGLFEDHGVTVETVPIEGGGGPVIAAMASGSVDVILQAINVVGGANQQGQEIQYFCGNSSDHSYTILTQPDSGLPTFEETGDWAEVMRGLEGTTFGIPGRGSALESFTLGLLEDAGVNPDSIEFRAIGFGDPARVAFEAGQVDAMMGYPFASSQLVRAGNAELALDLAKDGPDNFRGMFVDGFAASAEWLEANPDLADNFCAALRDANEWIADDGNHDALAELLRADFALTDDAVIEDAINGMSILKVQLPEANITTAIDFSVDTGQLQADPAVTYDNVTDPVPSAK